MISSLMMMLLGICYGVSKKAFISCLVFELSCILVVIFEYNDMIIWIFGPICYISLILMFIFIILRFKKPSKKQK